MMRNRTAAVWLAGVLAMECAFGVGAAPAVILGESETETARETAGSGEKDAIALSQGAAQEGSTAAISGEKADETEGASSDGKSDGAGPMNAEAEGITAEEAVRQARALYSKMKHYAELTDNENFASCFETAMDADTLQNQMKSVSQAEAETKNLTGHEDVCFLDPTKDKTQSPYYFGVGLTDYEVEKDGSVQWYSVLIRIAKYKDGWKAAALPEGNFFSGKYPEGYEAALGSGRNAVDLYPYLALRFSEKGVFDGAFYSLVNMAWQNTDGSLGLALWLANGQEGTKWCDSIDLVLTDGTKQVASVNTPVQQAVEGGQSMLVTVNIPAANVKTGTDKWSSLSVSSNLLYQ